MLPDETGQAEASRTPAARVRRLVRYGFAGVATTLVNLGIFHALLAIGVPYQATNLVAILSSKTFAFFANKRFVFRSKRANKRGLVMEVIAYVCARGFTGLVDFFGLILLVELFGLPVVACKYALTVVVIILNYLLARFVFKRRAPGDQSDV